MSLHAALPFPDQTEKWSGAQLIAYGDRYKNILAQCESVDILSDKYFKNEHTDAYKVRNIWMVDRSDLVLAVWNGQPSGSGKTVLYAKEQRKPCIVIDPDTLLRWIYSPDQA